VTARRFRKILIANRGEIAVRVIRACRDMGISPVAVHSTADRDSLHVRLADESHAIGPAPARDSYLRIEALLDAARRSGAEAIHPGYGFLSENPDFAEACEAAGIVFIGPPSAAMRAMGNKVEARRLMREAGVPVVPGTDTLPDDDGEAAGLARTVGYPMMIKAAAGGGGKGMRIVREAGELTGALRAARSESAASFADGSIYVERYVDRPRHIELQVLADSKGRTIHLGERECSIQRRHQKLIEESPSPVVDAATRKTIGAIAVRAARAVGYVSAGTVEMLRDEDGSFYFMEMNTRLQVEHPVTEMVTGVDLVRAQIEIASGGGLPCTQSRVAMKGHAIECRIYSEDPERNFMPSPGRIGSLRAPSGPFVRDDSGVYPGYEVPVHYDPLISKLIAWGRDRDEALLRIQRALDEYRIQGIRTTIPFLRRVVSHPAFVSGTFDTHFIDRHRKELFDGPAPVGPLRGDGAGGDGGQPTLDEIALIAAAVATVRKSGELSMASGGPGSRATGPGGGARSGWKTAARLGSLRNNLR
jgi:acetyl-CoA carboxylase biotin carboxylase subunit